MTKYVTVALIVCACAVLTAAQYNHLRVGFSDGYLATNFGPPSLNVLSAAASRDPRANTGPVVFPPSPPGDPSQTSGVVIGASGFGFQPPGSQGISCHWTDIYNNSIKCKQSSYGPRIFINPKSITCDQRECLIMLWKVD